MPCSLFCFWHQPPFLWGHFPRDALVFVSHGHFKTASCIAHADWHSGPNSLILVTWKNLNYGSKINLGKIKISSSDQVLLCVFVTRPFQNNTVVQNSLFLVSLNFKLINNSPPFKKPKCVYARSKLCRPNDQITCCFCYTAILKWQAASHTKTDRVMQNSLILVSLKIEIMN